MQTRRGGNRMAQSTNDLAALKTCARVSPQGSTTKPVAAATRLGNSLRMSTGSALLPPHGAATTIPARPLPAGRGAAGGVNPAPEWQGLATVAEEQAEPSTPSQGPRKVRSGPCG